jgi:ubiquinone/menaquinone biosynthesis C-methylase UbiE
MNSGMGSVGITETTKELVEKTYREYYAQRAEDRDDLLRNPQVIFQALACDASMIAALQAIRAHRDSNAVLDVGCGTGGSLLVFMRLGFEPKNLYGVDIQEERIRVAKTRFAAAHFECADACQLPYPSGAFDIVFESMMFLQITDDQLAGQIAEEMVRVSKPGGHIVICDWRYSKPGDSRFKAVSLRRISRLFRVGTHTVICAIFPGSLVPPVGRFLSKNLPSLYFLVRRLITPLAGQVTTVLQKIQR